MKRIDAGWATSIEPPLAAIAERRKPERAPGPTARPLMCSDWPSAPLKVCRSRVYPMLVIDPGRAITLCGRSTSSEPTRTVSHGTQPPSRALRARLGRSSDLTAHSFGAAWESPVRSSTDLTNAGIIRPQMVTRSSMTTLIGWVGVDSRRVTSIYLASDSRFTWTDGSNWDYGKKLFSTSCGTELLGYAGDVVFTSQLISQVIDQMSAGLFSSPADSADAKVDRLIESMRVAIARYPTSQRRDFDIAYVARQGENMNAIFYVATISWRGDKFIKTVKAHPSSSGPILTLGSGASFFRWRFRKLTEKGENMRTSRLVYTAFCDHLLSGEDPNTGGPPQLVGLFSSHPARTFGVIHKGERWMSGSRVLGNADWGYDVPWRDDLFQVCNGSTLQLELGAQPQPRTYTR